MPTPRRPKCVRCSRAVTDDNLIISDQGVFHRRCWMIQEAQELVRKGKKQIERSKARIERTVAALGRPTFGTTPICPVCLQPIKATEMVTGSGDDVMHLQCDYTNRLRSQTRRP